MTSQHPIQTKPPLFPDNLQFWFEIKRAFDASSYGSSETRMRFTDGEGAGAHCQVGAARLAFARMYAWLDLTVGVVAPG